jgi:hypothetical protein
MQSKQDKVNWHVPYADGSGYGSDVPYAVQTLRGGRGIAAKQEDLQLSDSVALGESI